MLESRQVSNLYGILDTMPYKDPKSEKALESLRAARRRHYHNNKEAYIERAKVHKNKLREYVKELKNNPCTDCGTTYPYYVMHFDHLSDKVDGINKMVANGVSMEVLQAEIAKCELVCANCHAERTFQRLTDKSLVV